MKVKVTSLKETKELAQAFCGELDDDGLFVTLTGDIGAGKTQFVRYALQYLGVKEEITSPSFVILNEYKSPRFPIYHFDLYRLEGKSLKTISEELREYSKKGTLTFVEWAQFGENEIPDNSFKINVYYDENNLDIRWFEFISKDEKFIKSLSKRVLK